VWKNEQGVALVLTLLTFLVLSVLGSALMMIGVANVGLTKSTTQYESAFYIAEAGVNQSVAVLENKAKELGALPLSHDAFFQRLNTFIDEHIARDLMIFEDNNGETPLAAININQDAVNEQQTGQYHERVTRYTLTSNGKQGTSNREVSTSFDVAHRISETSSGGGTIPSDFIFYSASNETLTMPNGGYMEGDFFAENIIFNSKGTDVRGSLVATNSIEIQNEVKVTGSLYALNGHVKLNDANAVVEEAIYAMGNVILTSGSRANEIYANGNIELLNNNNVRNAYAGGHVTTGSGVTTETIYAGGNVTLRSGNNNTRAIHSNGQVLAETSSTLSNIFTNNRFIFGSGITVNGNIHAQEDVGERNQGGNFTVNGNIYAGQDVFTRSYQTYRLNGDVHAGKDVVHGTNNTISGKVVAGGTLKQFNNQPLGVIGKTVTEQADPDTVDAPTKPIPPTVPDFSGFNISTQKIPIKEYTSTGESVVSKENRSTHYLTPGYYDRVTISYQDSLYFDSGTYYFNDFHLSSTEVKLYIDLSNGPVNVYSKKDIHFSHGTTLYVSLDGVNYTKIDKSFVQNNKDQAKEIAGQLYFEAHNKFYMHNDLTVLGTILANNDFEASSSVTIVGVYLVNNGKARIGNAPTMIYAPATTSDGTNHSSGGTGSLPGLGSGGGSGNGTNLAPVEVIIRAPVTES